MNFNYKKIILHIILFCLLNLFILTFMPSTTGADNPYLILHLDAVNSEIFFQELKKGNLPNIEKAFSGGGKIEHGLTLFPGATPMIVPRMPHGYSTDEYPMTGWEYYDIEEKRYITDPEPFMKVMSEVPRRSRSLFFLGFPGLDFFARMSIRNIPSLLEKYNVVEYYWMATDITGHLFGTERFYDSLYQFDRAVGSLAQNYDLSEVNLILYSDHGMVMEDVYTYDETKVLEDKMAEKIEYYKYPNLYLQEDVSPTKIAEKTIGENIFDLVFLKKDQNTVLGFSEAGKFTFTRQGAKYKYEYEGEDFFSYYEAGYKGDFLNRDQWLSLTKNLKYPGAVPNLYDLTMNPNSGDLVVVINPPRIPENVFYVEGNHYGITAGDLKVPVLMKGPDLKNLYDLETIWLHELYTEYIPETRKNFTNPRRENHSLALYFPTSADPNYELQVSYSPEYRHQAGLNYSDENLKIWYHYDIFSSFLTRIWLGPSLNIKNGRYDSGLSLQTEFKFDSFGARFNHDFFAETKSSISLFYDPGSRLRLQFTVPDKIGLQFQF